MSVENLDFGQLSLSENAKYWHRCLSFFDFKQVNSSDNSALFKLNYAQIENAGFSSIGNEPVSEGYAVVCLDRQPKFRKGAGINRHPLFAIPVQACVSKKALKPAFPIAILYNRVYQSQNSEQFFWVEKDEAEQLLNECLDPISSDRSHAESWREVWRLLIKFLSKSVECQIDELERTFSEIINAQSDPEYSSDSWSISIDVHPSSLKAVGPAISIYEELEARKDVEDRKLGLIRNLLFPEKAKTTTLHSDISTQLSGHMDEYDAVSGKRKLFPLDRSQRLAVDKIVNLKNSEVQAVNGPPGSGKTSMLKAAIASQWVNAVLEDLPCPITVACGATNQSVTNVIEAFASVAHRDESLPIAQRWIKGLPSYGCYFPAGGRVEEAIDQEHFVLEKTEGARSLFVYKSKAEKVELTNVSDSESELVAVGAGTNQTALDPVNLQDQVYYYLDCAKLALCEDFTELETVGKCLKSRLKALFELQKACLNRGVFTCSYLDKLKEIVSENSHLWHESSRGSKANALLAIAEQNLAEGTWCADTMQCLIDVAIRPEMFHLAARYLEGVFLSEQETRLLSDHPKNLEEGLRRVCMLTPCIVATLHTLPKLAESKFLQVDGKFEYSYGLFDMLVVDEAGQALPEIGAVAFSLAKKAVVVGDLKQLAPISNHTKATEKRFADSDFSQEKLDIISESGRSTLSGSVLTMARLASVWKGDDEGLTLTFHYRCKPSIVQYCSELCYDEKLDTQTREDESDDVLYPSMAWVEVSSEAKKVGGSFLNEGEANEISEWLVENWPVWKDRAEYKGKKIHQIVAILSPYRQQVELLKHKVQEKFKAAIVQSQASKEISDSEILDEWPSSEDIDAITMGTVHKLQGAERPIVCFSLVEGEDKIKNSFIDTSSSLMNVAVSRAKVSFIVFANPKRLFPLESSLSNLEVEIKGKPVLLLGKYLKRESGADDAKYVRKLYPEYSVLIEAKGKKKTLQRLLGKKAEVVETNGALLEISDVNGISLQGEIEEIDVSHFKPRFTVRDTAKSTIASIRKAILDTNLCILAMDDDSMGEYIAWQCTYEFSDELKGKGVERVNLQAVTEDAVKISFANPTTIDLKLAASEFVRNLCDFLVMKYCALYKARVKSNDDLNVGRVQLAMLGLLDELNTIPESYQDLKSLSVTIESGYDSYDGHLGVLFPNGDIKMDTRESTEPYKSFFKDSKVLHHRSFYQQRDKLEVPEATTLNIIKACWAKYGLPPAKTMSGLQDIYTGKWIETSGKETQKWPKYQTKCNKPDAEPTSGHPLIQPLWDLPPKQIKASIREDVFKVYQVVWDFNEALCSSYDFSLTEESRQYQTDLVNRKKSVLVFNREVLSEDALKFHHLWGLSEVSTRKKHSQSLVELPDDVEVAEEQIEVSGSYNDTITLNELLNKMEELGIGRPSTYDTSITGLLSRKLIELSNSDEPVELTSLGYDILNHYSRTLPHLCGPEFTNQLYNYVEGVKSGEFSLSYAISSLLVVIDPELVLDKTNPFDSVEELFSSRQVSRDEFTELENNKMEVK